MNIELLKRKYAYTLCALGMNVQKGQKVMIETRINTHDFALLLAEEAYKLGASKVNIVYLDLELNKLESKYLTSSEIEEIKDYERSHYNYCLEGDVCTIRLESEDPKLLEDVNDDYSHAIFSHIDNLRNIMRAKTRGENGCRWCIAIVPTQKWAEVVIPNEDKSIVLDKFWEVLFKLMLIDEDSDPIENWKNKMKRNKYLAETIDSYELVDLHYTSSNGTDLHVGLTPQSKFAEEYEESNKLYNLYNLPTEEIFTTPDKYLINGRVVTTKPLALGGKVIPWFALTFKDGKIINIEANECKELLEKTINTDEGSCYLGECALVAYHSPISMSNLVYYTTLIDENASCHLALGNAVSNGSYKDEEGIERFNQSSLHIDFMIGSKDTSIIGTKKDGSKVVIFKDGDFAF